MFHFTGIINNLLSLGVISSKKQYELLKWRTSEEAQKYYTVEENRKLYKALKKGDIRVVDAIRKEKQDRINNLKNNLLNSIIICICLFTISCSSIPVHEESWDVNSLKENEKTYQIKKQKIKTKEPSKKIIFDDDWYIVHEDFIKTFNENQDSLLNSLNQLKETKNKHESEKTILIFSSIGIILILLLFVLPKFFFNRIKK